MVNSVTDLAHLSASASCTGRTRLEEKWSRTARRLARNLAGSLHTQCGGH